MTKKVAAYYLSSLLLVLPDLSIAGTVGPKCGARREDKREGGATRFESPTHTRRLKKETPASGKTEARSGGFCREEPVARVPPKMEYKLEVRKRKRREDELVELLGDMALVPRHKKKRCVR